MRIYEGFEASVNRAEAQFPDLDEHRLESGECTAANGTPFGRGKAVCVDPAVMLGSVGPYGWLRFVESGALTPELLPNVVRPPPLGQEPCVRRG